MTIRFGQLLTRILIGDVFHVHVQVAFCGINQMLRPILWFGINVPVVGAIAYRNRKLRLHNIRDPFRLIGNFNMTRVTVVALSSYETK